MRSKHPSEGTLKGLPEEQQAAIADYALGHTSAETLDWLREQGIRVTGNALSMFLSQRQVRQQLAINAALLQILLEEVAKEDPTLTPGRIQELGQAFFSRMAIANQDSALWRLTQEIEFKRNRLALERQKFHELVEERKAAIRQEIERAKSGQGLTPETLERIEQELKLM
jgi:hypothetical protein